MLAGTYDISVPQNAEYSIAFQYVDASDVAIPITETVHFIVRRSSLPQEKNLFEIMSSGSVDEGYVAFPDTEFSYGDAVVANNQISITIKTGTLANILPGLYFYYLNLMDGDQNETLLKGRFTVEAP